MHQVCNNKDQRTLNTEHGVLGTLFDGLLMHRYLGVFVCIIINNPLKESSFPLRFSSEQKKNGTNGSFTTMIHGTWREIFFSWFYFFRVRSYSKCHALLVLTLSFCLLLFTHAHSSCLFLALSLSLSRCVCQDFFFILFCLIFGICCWCCFRFPGVFHSHSLFIWSLWMSVSFYENFFVFRTFHSDLEWCWYGFHIKYDWNSAHIYRFYYIF